MKHVLKILGLMARDFSKFSWAQEICPYLYGFSPVNATWLLGEFQVPMSTVSSGMPEAWGMKLCLEGSSWVSFLSAIPKDFTDGSLHQMN